MAPEGFSLSLTKLNKDGSDGTTMTLKFGDVVTVASHGGASRGGTPAITLECHVTVLVAE